MKLVDVDAASCSPSCRPSRASPRRAARSRRSPACSSPRRRRRRRRAARHRHGGRPARPAPGRRRARRARSCSRRGCCSTSCARCPAATCRSSCGPTEQDVEIVGGTGDASTSARCAPRTSRRCPSRAATRSSTMPAQAFVETIATCRPLGLARRDAPDPHRHPRLGAGRRAADGRDRLLPPERQGDAARGRRSTGGFEANVPARALQELERIVARRRRRADPHRRARQPGRLRGRRRRALARG